MLTDRKPSPLRAARERRGLTQVQLAVAANCAVQTISIAERTGHITLQSAEKLAAALGIDPLELVP
ncbi:MAG TPA: helix-turn-helix transcriptional regulator [Anaeromyxobacteraceae bacterium]|nr:helix-turn-helix transcriptional regulator [Anaeromyxobacteraceae bacterium]